MFVARSLRALFASLITLVVVSCSGGAPEGETSGSLFLQLELGNGDEIERVEWSITRPGMEAMPGLINTSAPGATASVEVYGLEPGGNYNIVMTALGTEGTECRGDTDFEIAEGQVTEIMVVLQCKSPQRLGAVRVNGEFNICAELLKAVVSPLQTSVGSDIDLSSEAVDAEADLIEYEWTASSGTIADPSAASTTYTCDEPGEHQVTITVSDDGRDHCESSWTIEVTCLELLEIPGLEFPAHVIRDTDGILHIYAKTYRDAALVQGFVVAGDRLFQIDATRRQVSGTLAELFGESVLGSDVELRTIGLRRAAERSFAALSEETRELLEAYAEGVNAWVAANALPAEYGLLELTQFEPWTPVDSVIIAKALAFQLSFGLDIGATQTFGAYVAELGPASGAALYFEDIYRSAPFDPASTVPDAMMASASLECDEGSALAHAPMSSPGQLLAQRYRDRIDDIPFFENALQQSEYIVGSNEWAVSGALTESGRPLMANDPHLALNTPATFNQLQLVASHDGLNVSGSGVPGTPMIIQGQNDYITWGSTNNRLDVTDTYQEQIVSCTASPAGLCTTYRGAEEPVIPVPVEFRVNVLDGIPDNLVTVEDGVPPAVLIVPRRNNGPIIDLDLGTGTAISVQYTGFSATRELDSFRLWSMAKNLDDFREGLQFFDVGSQNWAYSDIEGNIAYFTSAEMPIREDLQAANVDVARLPIFLRDGTGGNEWLPVVNPQPEQTLPYEILPMDEMPQIVNPDYYINANNDPAGVTLDNNPFGNLRPGGGIYYLNYSYAIGLRAGRITQALEEKLAAGPVTFEDMQEIQSDVVLFDAQVFTPFILEAFDRGSAGGAPAPLAELASDPRIVEAIGRLEEWDYTTPTGVDTGYDASDVDGVPSPPTAEEIANSIAATIYSVWRGQALNNIIADTLANEGLGRPGSSTSVKALRNLLDNFETNGGVGASGLDFFEVPGLSEAEDRRDFLLLKSLADALDRLAGAPFEAAFGLSEDQNDYRWGRLHRITFDAPLGGPFDVPPAGGTFPPSFEDLSGVATDGGFSVVDASSHSAYADNSEGFGFGSGPNRRYVGEPGTEPGSIRGETILPGGNSGVLGSPFYINLLPRWLTNETYRMRLTRGEVEEAAFSKTLFVPGD